MNRVFINDLWAQKYTTNTAKHMARTSSDYRPILFTCDNGNSTNYKYFKLVDFWTTHNDFQEVVMREWNQQIHGNPMWILQQKLKNLGRKLST